MFGRRQEEEKREPASDVARIGGGGLVQVIVTETAPLEFYVFLNGRLVQQHEVESLAIVIDDGGDIRDPSVRATLTRYVQTVTGARGQSAQELFPCVVEFVVGGRRLSVTCPEAGSLDGVWITLGMRPDGSGSEVTGARSLTVVLTEGLLDAKISWTDGTTDDLFPADG